MAKAKESREEARQEQQGGRQTGMARRESYAPSRLTSPSSMMNHFAEEMERLFSDFGFGRGWLAPRGWGETGQGRWSPQVEVFERGGQFVIRADLPGLNRENVRVDITDEALTIQGERKQEHEENREGWHRSERSYGSFYRSIPLPEGIDAGQAKASFHDGVLEITLPVPQRQEQRGRRLEITG